MLIRLFLLAALSFSLVLPARAQVPSDEPAALRIRAVGDVMMGTDFPSEKYLPPQNGVRFFERVRPLLLNADLTFANLEGPFLDGGSTAKCDPGENCYAFRTPTRYGRYLDEIDLDLASIANNHARDFGRRGQRSTTQMLDSLGIAWSGPPGTTALRRVERNGLRVGLAAFHTAQTSNYLNDHDRAAWLVDSLARESDVTVVSFHGGAEGADAQHVPDTMEIFYGEKRGHLRAFTHRVIDAGADLVLGHGPHVPRGMEVYRERLIAYSLGNFATYGRFNLSGPLGVGMVLEASLDRKGRFLRGRLLATRQLGEGVPAPDPGNRAVRLVRSLSAEDFPKRGVLVAGDGLLLDRRRVTPLPPRSLHEPEPLASPPTLASD
jgi:hypothetical protein